MLVLTIHLELRLNSSSSLKEKRRVVSSVKKRLATKFNVSVSEVGSHASWRVAELGIAAVTGDKRQADRILEAVTRFLDADARLEITHRVVEYF
jgi:uncharacterized protein YlxP (DUF503 family)